MHFTILANLGKSSIINEIYYKDELNTSFYLFLRDKRWKRKKKQRKKKKKGQLRD